MKTYRTWSALLVGLGFAVSLFVGVAIVETPRNAPDLELVAWWSDSTNRLDVIVSMYAFALAGVLFLALLSHLHARMAALPGTIPRLVHGAGIAFAVLLIVVGAVRGAIAKTVDLNGEPLPGIDVLRYLPALASTLLGVFGMFAVTVVMLGTTWLALRDHVLPHWMAWLGVLGAVAAVALNVFGAGELGLPAVLLWSLGLGGALRHQVLVIRTDVAPVAGSRGGR